MKLLIGSDIHGDLDGAKRLISAFEEEKCDCIVTWHAAYSPSLESIDALAGTDLPIVVLDTTETYDFFHSTDPDAINLNHGIHGVMDMTNMLLRRGKAYAIAAGHFPQSDVIEKASRLVKAAAGAMGTIASVTAFIITKGKYKPKK